MPIFRHVWEKVEWAVAKCSCGGFVDHLKVNPPRNPFYYNDIWMCRDCKAIYP